MSDRPLLFHAPEGASEGRFDRSCGAIMVAATPGIVLDVPGGFERDGAVGALGGEAGWLVEAGAQGVGGRLDVEASAADEEEGIAVAQQGESGVGVERHTVGEAGLARAKAEVPD